MDTVGALNKYKMKLAGDSLSFEILHHIYLDDIVTEAVLLDRTKAEKVQVKKSLRSLYLSNLVSSESSGAFLLTPLGEALASEFGADRIVAPLVLADLGSERDILPARRLFEFCSDFEPEYASWATASFKNTRIYLSQTKDVSPRERENLIWSSGIHPDSKIRIILKNQNLTANDLLGLAPRSSQAARGLAEHLGSLRIALEALDKSDALFVSSCSSDFSLARGMGREEMHLSALRILNYATTRRPDYLIETCVKASSLAATHMVEGILNVAAPGSASLFGMFKRILVLWPDISRSLKVADLAGAIALIADKKSRERGQAAETHRTTATRAAIRVALDEAEADLGGRDVASELRTIASYLGTADPAYLEQIRDEALSALAELGSLLNEK